MIGLGIGLTLPVQSGAAVATLLPAQLGVGSAVTNSFRQMGAVLGISIFAALVGSVSGNAEIHAYHRIWLVFAALSIASGAVLWILRTRRPVRPA